MVKENLRVFWRNRPCPEVVQQDDMNVFDTIHEYTEEDLFNHLKELYIETEMTKLLINKLKEKSK
jgi:hypothetical protein